MNRHFIEEPLMRLGEKKTPAQPASPLWQGFRGVPHLEINRETGKMRYNPPEPAPIVKRVTRPAATSGNTLEFKGGGTYADFCAASRQFTIFKERTGQVFEYLEDWRRSGHEPNRPQPAYMARAFRTIERVIARCLYHGLGFAITAHPNGTFDITIKE